MLQNIHIENFRCFEDFETSGFERINLIGGKNNSGKTCLLEAILCLKNNENFKTNQLQDIAELRGEKIEDLLNQNLRVGTKIQGTIRISGNNNESFAPEYKFTSDVNKVPGITNFTQTDLQVFYISQTKSSPNIDFDDIFYRVEIEERTKDFVDVLMEIDSSITNIRTIGRDGMGPKIKEERNKNFINLSSYGDAVKSVIRYFSPIIEREVFEKNLNTKYILLIDEIENGLHYTVYHEFWKKIFTASKKLNIQIFATTHSLEMIQQFNKVAKEEGGGAYFEMGREFETGKIFAFKHDTELLSYELEPLEAFESSHSKPTFRGG